jgi:hypothetical protein
MIWHYIPLIICVSYISLFYLVCVVFYPRENFFNFSSLLCASIGYNNAPWLSSFDWISNMLLPLLLIPLTSVALLLSVVLQAKKWNGDWPSDQYTEWVFNLMGTISFNLIGSYLFNSDVLRYWNNLLSGLYTLFSYTLFTFCMFGWFTQTMARKQSHQYSVEYDTFTMWFTGQM